MSKKDLLNCIQNIIHQKGYTMEEYLQEKLMESVQKLKREIGDSRNFVVYPSLNAPSRRSGGDIIVPGLIDKLTLAFDFEKIKRDPETGIIIVAPSSPDGKIIQQYKIPTPPIGWYMSEKFDGYRALWDGEKFVSRRGNVMKYVPEWFQAIMPPGIALDGELFLGREDFEGHGFLKSKIKPEAERNKNAGRGKPGDDKTIMELDLKWIKIGFNVFDIPSSDKPFEQRMTELEHIVKERCKIWELLSLPPYLRKERCPLIMTEQHKIKSEEQLMDWNSELTEQGAEGVMIRAPNAPYIPRRTRLMLKIKPEMDAECKIVGYNEGAGKYVGKLGSFQCQMIEEGRLIPGKIVNVGGMIDEIRGSFMETHPVGTVITYKYSFITGHGMPRHPRYKGIRWDVPSAEELEGGGGGGGEEHMEEHEEMSMKERMIDALEWLITDEKTKKEKGFQFKVATYGKSLKSLQKHTGKLDNINDVIKALQVGGQKDPKKTIAKMKEVLESGTLERVERVKADPRIRIIDTLMTVPELGATKAKELADEYGVESIADLKKFNRANVLNDKGKSVLSSAQKIGIKYYDFIINPKTFKSVKIPRAEIYSYDNALKSQGSLISSWTFPVNLEIVGSYRREVPESGDIDVLLTSTAPAVHVLRPFVKKLQEAGLIIDQVMSGDLKFRGISKLPDSIPRRIDITFSDLKEYPFNLLHSTGSGDFNIELRKIAIEQGFKLTDKGIFKKGTDIPVSSSTINKNLSKFLGRPTDKNQIKTEKDIFNFLGMEEILPQFRTSEVLKSK